MYLVFTCMPADSYCRRLKSLLCLCDVFRAELTPLCQVSERSGNRCCGTERRLLARVWIEQGGLWVLPKTAQLQLYTLQYRIAKDRIALAVHSLVSPKVAQLQLYTLQYSQKSHSFSCTPFSIAKNRIALAVHSLVQPKTAQLQLYTLQYCQKSYKFSCTLFSIAEDRISFDVHSLVSPNTAYLLMYTLWPRSVNRAAW